MRYAEAVKHATQLLDGIEEAVQEDHDAGVLLLSQFVGSGEHDFVADSERNPFAWEALAHAASGYLARGEALPLPLAAWVIDVLHGTRKKPPLPPSLRRGLGFTYERRDYLLYRAVEDLVQRGLRATRGDTSPATSACDVVAEAMRRRRATPASFKDIKRAYLNIKAKLARGEHPFLSVAVINEEL